MPSKKSVNLFPFSPSPIQRKLLKSVYKCLEERGILFLEAPTGAGKTLISISASLSYARERGLKVIYVSRTHRECQKSLNEIDKIRRKTGRYIKSLIIGGKSRFCPFILNEGFPLNLLKCKLLRSLDLCPYYRRFLEDMGDLIRSINLENTFIDLSRIKACPYYVARLMIDLCDLISMPYFYIFGHGSFDLLFKSTTISPLQSILIVDEAHNLIDFVFQTNKLSLSIKEVDKAIKESKKLNLHLEKPLSNLRSFFLKTDKMNMKAVKEKLFSLYTPLKIALFPKLKNLLLKRSSFYPRNICKILLFTQEALKPSGQIIRNVFVRRSPPSIIIAPVKISDFIQNIITPFYAILFVSATLSPIFIYDAIFGVNKIKKRYKRGIHLTTNFLYDNVKSYVIKNIGTCFYERSRTMFEKIALSISAIFKKHAINGLIAFFPSRKMAESVLDLIPEQYKELTLKEEELLAAGDLELKIRKFVEDKGKIMVFSVAGGRLAEGVDIGVLDSVCVVGIPLPPPTLEMQIKAKLFENELSLNRGEAKTYSYIIPAFNKLIHAIGRVLRGPNRPIKLFLLDERYLLNKYRGLLPSWIREEIKVLDVNRLIS